MPQNTTLIFEPLISVNSIHQTKSESKMYNRVTFKPVEFILRTCTTATPDIDVKKITQQVMEECSRLTLVETNKQKEKVDRRF